MRRSILFITLLLLAQAQTFASESNYLRSTKAGMDIYTDKKTWREDRTLTADLGKPLGFEQMFVSVKSNPSQNRDHWRAVKVDFKNAGSPSQNALTQKSQRQNSQLQNLCVANSGSSLPKPNGFECVYKIQNHNKLLVLAVKKITKNIRSPASKNNFEFTRYVVFVEQNPSSLADFTNWISKSREIP